MTPNDRLFVIDGTLIVNVVVVAAEPWSPPEGFGTIAVPDGCGAGIGWHHINGAFVPPPPADEVDANG